MLSNSTLHRTWEQANSEQRLTFSGHRDSILIGLVLAGFHCACTSSYITFKLLRRPSPMIFLDWPQGGGGPTMLIYYNVIKMKHGPCSTFCTGAVMIHQDSELFQKVGTTSLRTGSLFCINVLCLSPGVPLKFPPSYLLPLWHILATGISKEQKERCKK